jgi:hypothetical protein
MRSANAKNMVAEAIRVANRLQTVVLRMLSKTGCPKNEQHR